MKIFKGLLRMIQNEKGVALLIAMMMLIMLTILGLAAIMTSSTDINIAGNLKNANNSLFVAEGAVDEAKMRLNPVSANAFPTLETSPGYTTGWGYYITSATAAQLQNASSPYYDADYKASYTVTPSLQSSISFQWAKTSHYQLSNQVQCYSQSGPVPCAAGLSAIEQVTAQVNVNGTSKQIVALLQPVSNPLFQNAAFGVNSVTVSNNAGTDDYTSVSGTNPAGAKKGTCSGTTCTCGTSGGIATNGTGAGAVTIGGGNTKICGTVTDGVGSTGSTISNSGTITGTPQTQTSTQNIAVTTPTLPGTCTNITADVTGLGNNGTLALATKYPGSTCFYATGSISMNNGQTVTFPNSASFYFTGSLTMGNNAWMYPASYAPADLIIYGTSTATSVQFSNNAWIYAGVYAPTANVTIDNNGTFFGAVVGQTVNINNNGMIHYDSNISKIAGTVSSYKNYSWNQIQ